MVSKVHFFANVQFQGKPEHVCAYVPMLQVFVFCKVTPIKWGAFDV